MVIVYLERFVLVIAISLTIFGIVWYLFGNNGAPEYSKLETTSGYFEQVEITDELTVIVTLKEQSALKSRSFESAKVGTLQVYEALEVLEQGESISILHRSDDTDTVKFAYQVKINGVPIDVYEEFEVFMNKRHRRFIAMSIVCLFATLYLIYGKDLTPQ